MKTMRNVLKNLTLMAITLVGSVTAASAGGSALVQMSIGRIAVNGSDQPGEIPVEGAAGRYDRVETVSLPLPFALAAELSPEAGNLKLVGSEVFLKAEGTGKDAHGVSALPGGTPAKTIRMRQGFTFELQARGPVAQNAIALCNGLPAAERAGVRKLAMSVAVVWRVTTGRFNFKWTNYDHVAPSDDIQNNRDFYGDQDSIEAEAIVDVPVLCQPLAGAAVATKSTAAPFKQALLVPAASQAAPAPALKVVDDKPIVVTPVATASIADPIADGGRPQCDGGMVRQVGAGDSGYLCLCPGNTKRVETGDNAFACERPRR
jgi:hypothetical protein